MDITVIIISYNTVNLTLNSIDSVKKYTNGLNYEIIVVDNASSDGSVNKIKNIYPDIILIENIENEGFGRANNKAIKNAKGEFVFLLNSDAFLTSNSLLVFYNFMKNGDVNVAVCGGELFTGTAVKTASFGNFPCLKQAFYEIGFFRFTKKKYLREIVSDVVNYDDKIKKVDFLIGADMFIRKQYLLEYGSFDEDFFLYFEEIELSYRFHLKGLKSFILPSEKIIHLSSASQFVGKEEFNYLKYERMAASRSLFYKKCYGNANNIIAKACYMLKELLEHIFLFNQKNGSLYRKMALIIKS